MSAWITLVVGFIGGWIISAAVLADRYARAKHGSHRAAVRVNPKVLRAPLSPSGVTRPHLVVVHRVNDMRPLVLDGRAVAGDLRRAVDKVKREAK
jgi:hypothetical protein